MDDPTGDPIIDGAVIDGPSPKDAKKALDAHVEKPDPAAADLPTDLKIGDKDRDDT